VNREMTKALICLCWIVSVTSFLFAAGCASAPKTIAPPPSPPAPAIVKVSFHVEPNVNPDANSRASPVVVKFYELKSTTAFDNGDFFSIFDEEQKAMDAELLDSETLQLRPGETFEFDKTFKTATRYLGVVAAFRDIEHSQWRATLPVSSKEKISHVVIQLDGNKILIRRE
jgi:type VI secretion system protein VasD